MRIERVLPRIETKEWVRVRAPFTGEVVDPDDHSVRYSCVNLPANAIPLNADADGVWCLVQAPTVWETVTT